MYIYHNPPEPPRHLPFVCFREMPRSIEEKYSFEHIEEFVRDCGELFDRVKSPTKSKRAGTVGEWRHAFNNFAGVYLDEDEFFELLRLGGYDFRKGSIFNRESVQPLIVFKKNVSAGYFTRR